MEFVDIDRTRYQHGRCIVDISVRGFAPEIGLRSGADGDRLVISHGGWQIVRTLVLGDGSGRRHMEQGELWERRFWHGDRLNFGMITE